MLYVILIILGLFFEEEGTHRKLRVIGHIAISIIIILVTFYAFFNVDALKPNKVSSQTTQNWRVALPYMDMTLIRNFGVKDDPVQSVYIFEVSATSRLEALNLAKKSFFSEKGPNPFVAKTKKTQHTMVVLEGNIVVEPLMTR